jgi:hypothetical protein
MARGARLGLTRRFDYGIRSADSAKGTRQMVRQGYIVTSAAAFTSCFDGAYAFGFASWRRAGP